MEEQQPDDYFADFKESLESILEKSQDDFEKQLIYISGGALSISMFFIEKVIKDLHQASNKWLLITSWFLFGVTLFVNLFSHFLAGNSVYKTLSEINCDDYDKSRADKRNQTISTINISTLCSLGLGVLLLILFITINI